MKKIISIVLSALLSAATLSPALAKGYNDVKEDTFFAPAIDFLSECGIMQGMSEGYFSPDSSITRAEMSVIAVKTADVAVMGGMSCLFYDVADSHWGIPYINTAAENSLLIGYPDGSFAPDKNLTYAEVAAVILRLMGYTSRELGRYPDGYIQKAEALGISDGLELGADNAVDRKTTAYILANALLKDKNNSSSKLISDLGYTLSNEVTVLSGYNAAGDEIVTSGGTYHTTITNKAAYTAMRGKLILDSDDTAVAFMPQKSNVINVTIAAVSGNHISYTDADGNIGSVYIPSDRMLYYHDEHDTFLSLKSLINAGDKLAYTLNENGFDYGVLYAGYEDEGFVVYDTIYNCGIEADFENAEVIRNGTLTDVSAVRKYDVVYRGEGNVIYAYSKKVSGIYEQASPSRTNPTSVTVSGSTYTIETDTAKRQLGDYEGALNTGDNITLLLGRNNEIAGALKTSAAGRCVGVRSILGNDISCFENGANVTIHMENTQNVVCNGRSTSYSNVKNDLSGDYILTLFYNENGSLDYGVFEEYELLGPVIAASDGANSFNAPVAAVVRGDKIVSVSDIKRNDVLYYNDMLDTIYAYNDTVTGTYEKAIPDKSSPTTVTVSGKNYEIETAQVQSALSKFEINSTITLLLGRDGKAAGIISDGTAGDVSNSGVIVSCSDRVVNGTKEYYVKALTASGETLEIKTDREYKDFRGRACRFEYKNGVMTPTTVRASLSGAVNHKSNTVGNYHVADNCSIIDVAYRPESSEATDARADYVTFNKLTKTTLSSEDVLYFELNAEGEIELLILDNVTHSAYSFGIAAAKSANNSFNYRLDFGGVEREYRLNKNIVVGKSEPVMLLTAAGKAVDIEKLILIKTSSDISGFNEKQITLDNEVYTLADNAAYYFYDGNRYAIISVKDLKEKKIKSAQIYSDYPKNTSGAARIVLMN